MMSAFALALLLGLQTPASITYTDVAKPVGAVLQELSKATGLHLKADADANREIVLVSVKDMPLQTFLDRLASVTSCKWDKRDDQMVLMANLGQRTREADDEFQARVKSIAKEIQKSVDDAAKGIGSGPVGVVAIETDKADDPSKAGAKPNLHPDPGATALNQILSKMDPAAIASVLPGQRGVWATNSPTGMQGLLPDGSPALITEWIQQHNATTSKSKANADTNQFEQAMPKELLDMMRRETQPVTKAPFKALLVVKQSSFMSPWLGLQISLTAYDDQGNPLIQTQTMLDAHITDIVAAATGKKKADPKPATETPIAFSDDSKELMSLFGTVSQNGLMMNVPPALQAKLRHPDVKDPLAYMASDQLLAVAKHDGRQLIADLPDESFGLDMPGSAPVSTVESVQKELDDKKTLVETVDGDCLLIKPAKPSEDRRGHIDRQALTTLLAATEAKRQPSLDDVCSYALANEPPFSNPIGMVYCMAFVPSLMGLSLSGSFPDWSMFRFYGSLSPVQQEGLRSGEKLAVSSLTEPQRAYASAVLFGADAQFRPAGKAPSETDMVSRMMTMFTGGGGSGAMDATELMPNGLPPSAYVTCAVTDEPIVQALDASGKAGPWCLSAGDLAMFDMISSMPAAAGAESGMPTSGLLGHRTDLAFVFTVSANAALDQTLWDASIAADAQRVALSALPKDFQALVDRHKTELKNSPLGMMQAMPMFRNTPPP